MRLFKSSFFISVILISINGHPFTGNECLNKTFQVSISHQGKPFGLSKVNLDIAKTDCTIVLKHEKFKYLKSSWSIDVCREPIHIKKDGGSDVLKKINECTKKSKDDFCENRQTLLTIIQDDALIFAEGEKEKMDSNHGKSYCAYLLLKEYLDESKVFNRGQDYYKLFENGYSSKSRSKTIESNPKTVVPRPFVEGVDVQIEPVKNGDSQKPEVSPAEKPKGVGTY
jgi:hypothetical protein